MALLAAIVSAGAGISYETALVVKITAFYSVTDRAFGVLLGVTTLVMALAAGPWGFWADRHARVRLIKLAQGIAAASMLAAGLGLELRLPYGFFFAVKLLSGIGLGGIGLVATSAVMDTVPREKRGAAFGWAGVSWVAGGAIGLLMPSVCMLLKLSLGVTYFLGGGVGFLFLAALFFVEEPRRGAQDEALRDSVGAGKAEYDYRIRFSDLKMLLLKPANLILLMAVLLFQFPAQVLVVWFVTFLMRNHGLNEFIATQLMFLAFLGQPFGNAFGGAWTDRAFQWKRRGRPLVMMILAAFAPVFLVSAMVLPFKWIWFAPLMILANFFLVASGPGLTTVSLEVNLPEHRGTITAIMSIWSNLARALAWYLPPMIAAALGGRYDRAFVLTAAAFAPLLILYLLMTLRVEKDLDHVNGILQERAEGMLKN